MVLSLLPLRTPASEAVGLGGDLLTDLCMSSMTQELGWLKGLRGDVWWR
jgi:hypothetical protein